MLRDPKTWWWWTGLRAAAVLNLALFVAVAQGLPHADGPVRLQLLCAGTYTVVCAFRSFFPRVDLERTVLVDSPLSSIALGRSAATVAELAFTLQLALFVAALGSPAVAAALLPLITVAQVCCWLGVLTLDHRWHAAEETLWAVAMALLVGVFAGALTASAAWLRPVLLAGIAGSLGAAWVMAGVDVPMYFQRARAHRAAGGPRLGVLRGLGDAVTRRAPTGHWDVWRHEVLWMTPYFTVGVWISLALVRLQVSLG